MTSRSTQPGRGQGGGARAHGPSRTGRSRTRAGRCRWRAESVAYTYSCSDNALKLLLVESCQDRADVFLNAGVARVVATCVGARAIGRTRGGVGIGVRRRLVHVRVRRVRGGGRPCSVGRRHANHKLGGVTRWFRRGARCLQVTGHGGGRSRFGGTMATKTGPAERLPQQDWHVVPPKKARIFFAEPRRFLPLPTTTWYVLGCLTC